MVMKKNIFSIDNRIIAICLSILCALTFIRPEFLYRNDILNYVYKFFRILIPCVIVLFSVCNKTKISLFTMLWIIFQGMIILITFCNGGDIGTALLDGFTIISLGLMFDLYKNDLKILINSLFFVLSFMILINFLSIIFFPNGLYAEGLYNETTENWFLGFKNKHLIYYLPCTILCFKNILNKEFKPFSILILVVIILSTLFINSSTLILSIALCFCLVLPFVRKSTVLFNGTSYLLLYIILFFGIVVFRMQHVFSFLIEDLLGKDLSLTNRTVIWDTTFTSIIDKPLFGWGVQTNEFRNNMYNSLSFVSAHNQLLEFTYIGGIALAVFYVGILVYMAYKLTMNKKNVNTQIAAILFFAMNLCMLVEVYTDTLFYIGYFLIMSLSLNNKVVKNG